VIHPTLANAPDSAVAVQSVWDFAEKGGIIMIPLALCSLAAIAVAAERLIVLRASRVIPKGIADRADEAIRSGQSADEFRQAERSPAGRLLAAGMEKLGHGTEIVERHLAAEGEHEVHVMRRRLRVLVVITALAPLLGLTGTIFGMIRAFQTVALSSEALGKAELLARGIYEAMITTAAGLLVAMPTIVLYHFLAGRIEQMAHELDRLAVAFVNRHLHDALPANPGSASPRRTARAHEPRTNGEPVPEITVTAGDARESAKC
jgi:biopolymer transport protein ExbB